MSFIKLEFPEHNISISTQQTQDVNLYLCEILVFTQYTELYENADVIICLPVQDLILRSKILSILKNKTEVLIWQYSDSDFTQNKKLLSNGLIMNKSIHDTKVNIMIYGKAWLLQQTQLPARYKIVSTTYSALIKEVLKLCQLDTIFTKIIYPTQANNAKINARLRELASEEGGLLTGYNQSIYDFLSILFNNAQIYLTTVYIDNELYLYHIDTAQIVQEKLSLENNDKMLEIFLNPNSTNSNIISYNFDSDFTLIYDQITVATKGSIAEDRPAITTTIQRKNIQQSDLMKKLSQSALPPMLYTTRCKNDLGKAELQSYAKYLLKKQIHSSLIVEIEFVGHYPKLTNPKNHWCIAMPVKIPKTDQNNNVNMLYNDLIADYELSSVDFVVAGYDMIFNNDQRSTIVRIVPSEFMEYDKTLKLMKPKVI